MRKETKVVYIAYDGVEFNTEVACIAYEKRKYLTDYLQDCFEKSGLDHEDTSPGDYVQWLLLKYDIVEKSFFDDSSRFTEK